MQGVEPAADSVFVMDSVLDGLTRSRHSSIRYPAHHLPARPENKAS